MKDLRWYELTYSPEEIRLVTSAESIVLRKRSCSESVMNPFLESLGKLEKSRELRSGERANHVNIELNGKSFVAPRKSAEAMFLKEVPHEMRRMLIQESFRCDKGRGQKAL